MYASNEECLGLAYARHCLLNTLMKKEGAYCQLQDQGCSRALTEEAAMRFAERSGRGLPVGAWIRKVASACIRSRVLDGEQGKVSTGDRAEAEQSEKEATIGRGKGKRAAHVGPPLDPNSCMVSRTIGKGSRARLRWERKRKRHPESLAGNASVLPSTRAQSSDDRHGFRSPTNELRCGAL